MSKWESEHSKIMGETVIQDDTLKLGQEHIIKEQTYKRRVSIVLQPAVFSAMESKRAELSEEEGRSISINEFINIAIKKYLE